MSNRLPNDGSDHRDADLARRFAADPVPQHGSDFWSNLNAKLSTDSPDLAELDPVSAPADETALLDVVPLKRRRRSIVPLAMAAASIAVVGLGIAAILSATGPTTSLDSADVDTSQPDPSGDETPPTTEVPVTVTSVPPIDSTVVEDPQIALPVDYFAPSIVTAIGPGQIVGFSPDEASVLIVDEAIDAESGCEGAELLDLYAQDLASGERRRVLPAGMTVETGGMELMMLPGDSLPGGHRSVSLTDYCDGVRSGLWTGSMSADGTITDVVTAEIDSLDDPFTPSGVPTAEVLGAIALSSDRSLGLYLVNDEAAVRPTNPDGADNTKWRLDDVSLVGGGSFDPTGQVVAITGQDVFHLWNFRTGEVASTSLTSPLQTRFAESGKIIAVQTYGSEPTVSLVTFGDSPAPAFAVLPETPDTPGPRSCSGDIELASLSADDLVAQGVPAVIAEKILAIDSAAAACDWAALGELVGLDFTASFGGGDAVELWQSDEEGRGVMGILRRVLRQPFAGDEATDGIYTWPEVFTRAGCDAYTDRDRESLADLGYDAADVANECELVGSYLGYRVGIDTSGQWLFFVAGD